MHCELGNLQTFGRLMGHIKMDWENYLNIKKTYVIYHYNPLFGICHIYHFDLLSLIHIEVWSGLEVFWRTSEREWEDTVWSHLYVVFVATELHPDNIFFHHFLTYNNIKIKNYPLSLKVSRKTLALLKKIPTNCSFLLTYSLISQEFKYLLGEKKAKPINLPD